MARRPIAAVMQRDFDVVIRDLIMHRTNGISVLKKAGNLDTHIHIFNPRKNYRVERVLYSVIKESFLRSPQPVEN